MNDHDQNESVAIIGMAGRFPDAPDVGALWRNLLHGVGSIRPLTEEELAAVDPAVRRHPDFVAVTSAVADVDRWDAPFFGFSPREAEYTDPQQRLFLECSWEALENAGYDPRNAPGVVGVVAGCGFPTYLQNNIAFHDELIAEVGHLPIAIGNDRDGLTTMVSYKLDLHGPSMAVQTSCSTSMLAVHMACQSLLTYESDMMLAGGSAIQTPQAAGYVYADGGIVAPDGKCRSLDAQGRGGVFANGVGVVVLKRTADALRDGDRVYATIIGTAANNDGVARAGYAAPGLRGQIEVIVEAMANADVGPDDISYVEAHGTGTLLGDAIELDALGRAFADRDRSTPPCLVGSVKANIGHVDRASGVTGLIKTALMLHHRTIPPQINFDRPNPNLDTGLFRVTTELTGWPAGEGPRRAVVDSFGLGGSNAVAVLQEAPAPVPLPEEPARPQLLVLSARTPAALDASTENLREHLDTHPGLRLADVAHTLQTGRRPFNHRRIVTASTCAEAAAALADPEGPGVFTANQNRRDRGVTLVIPARPTSDPAVGRALHAAEPVFRAAFDAAAEAAGVADPFADDGYPPRCAYALGVLLRSWVPVDRALGVGAGARVADCLEGTAPLSVLGTEPADGVGRAAVAAELAAEGRIYVELGDGRLLRDTDSGDSSSGAGHRLATLPEGLAAADAPRAVQELLGRLWLAGVDPLWAKVHVGPRRRVRLPSYPFERSSYWISPISRSEWAGWSKDRREDVADWFYLPAWRQAPRPVLPALSQRLADAGPWLLAGPETPLAKALADRLDRAGAAVRRVDWEAGTPFDPEQAQQWVTPRPRTVLYLWALDAAAPGGPASALPGFDERLELGFYGLRRLLGAIAADPGSEPVRIVAVTRGAARITGAEAPSPADAALTGLARVVPQENPGVGCRVVDVDGTAAVEALLADAVDPDPTTVAYRDGARWSLGYDRLRLPEPAGDAPALRDGGVYLLTGGLGQVCLAIAEHLATTRRARLALLGHSPLPPAEEWDGWLAGRPADDRTSRQITAIRALEAAGAEVLVVAADVADPAAVAAAVAAVRGRFGEIHGVIHGAGVSADEFFGLTHDLPRSACDEHFRAKVRGLAAVADAVDLDRLDFCVTLSSLATVLGALGHGPYAAANAGLDALVGALAAEGHDRVLTVDWDSWQNSGEKDTLGGAATVARYQMSYAEGCAALERALTAVGGVPHLVNSTGDLEPRLREWVTQTDDVAGSEERHPRPALATPFVPPADEVEQAVAEAWQDVMGLLEVGVLDNFFELGGHSLMAVQVIGRVRKALGLNVPLAVLAECPTVRQLADKVRELRVAPAGDAGGGEQ